MPHDKIISKKNARLAMQEYASEQSKRIEELEAALLLQMQRSSDLVDKCQSLKERAGKLAEALNSVIKVKAQYNNYQVRILEMKLVANNAISEYTNRE